MRTARTEDGTACDRSDLDLFEQGNASGEALERCTQRRGIREIGGSNGEDTTADRQADGSGIQRFVRWQKRLSLRGPLPRDVRTPSRMVHERGRLELHVGPLLLDEQKLRGVLRECI